MNIIRLVASGAEQQSVALLLDIVSAGATVRNCHLAMNGGPKNVCIFSDHGCNIGPFGALTVMVNAPPEATSHTVSRME